MRSIVQETFRAWSKQFEGEVPWMYLDVKGLVTVGVGNLIDPIGAALGLPFLHADGSKALFGEISAEWHTIKNHQELAHQGYQRARGFCRLHLSDDGISALVASKLASNWAFMARYFPNQDTWPAAAQLASSSLAWAIGAGWPLIFKNCAASAKAENWAACAFECEINEHGNLGVVSRNKAMCQLFKYAAAGNDPDTLPVPDHTVLLPEVEICG